MTADTVRVYAEAALDRGDLDSAGLRAFAQAALILAGERDALAAALDARTHEYDPVSYWGKCGECDKKREDPVHRTSRAVLDNLSGRGDGDAA